MATVGFHLVFLLLLLTEAHCCDRNRSEVFLPDDVPQNLAIKLGFLISLRTSAQLNGLKVPGALLSAVEYVNKQGILPEGYQLQFKVKYSMDDEEKIIKDIQELEAEGVHGIIGPDIHCASAARFANSLNLPVFSYACRDQHAALFNTFMSLSPSNHQMVQALASVVRRKVTWDRVTIINTLEYETEAIHLIRILESLENEIDHRYIRIERYSIKESNSRMRSRQYQKIVKHTKGSTSAYILLANYLQVNDLWEAMDQFGLLKKNKDVSLLFADEEEFPSQFKLLQYIGFRRSRAIINGSCNKAKSELTRSSGKLLVVAAPMSRSPFAQKFIEMVRQKNKEEPFCLMSVKGMKRHIPLDISSALFDSVMLYSKAVRDVYLSRLQTLKKGKIGVDYVARDGNSLVNHISNTTFSSVLGNQVYLDGNGIISGHFKLYSMRRSKKCGPSYCHTCFLSNGYIKGVYQDKN